MTRYGLSMASLFHGPDALKEEIARRLVPTELGFLVNEYRAALRRWGERTIEERPYLAVYSERIPEHLNEAGVSILADHLAPLAVRKAGERPSFKGE